MPLPEFIEIVRIKEYREDGSPALYVQIGNKDSVPHSIDLLLTKWRGNTVTKQDTIMLWHIPPGSMMEGKTTFEAHTTDGGKWFIMGCNLWQGKTYTVYNLDTPIPLGIKDSSPCFVTTAAFGGAHHPMVETCRGFRDEVLANCATGRAFIRWYDRMGPRMALLIEGHRVRATLARFALTPIALLIGVARRFGRPHRNQ